MDLFAGIGGASYAGKLIGNWRTVCYVEWDDYCQRVIQQQIKDGIFDDAPIWGDICTFDGKPWAGSVDIITAGFPCQPFSVAGKRRGEADERNMWPETLRVISEVRPRFAFLENVPGLLTARQKVYLMVLEKSLQYGLFTEKNKNTVAGRYLRSFTTAFGSTFFGRILGDLSEIGYDCRWTIVSAADVGAPHLRKRLWILAYPVNCSDRGGRGQDREEDGIQEINRKKIRSRKSGRASKMADPDNSGSGTSRSGTDGDGQTENAGRQGQLRLRIGGSGEAQNPDNDEPGQIRWWDVDPADLSDTDSNRGIIKSELGRVAHGIPDRCNRLKGLGNAWVPATAMEAWFRLTRGLI